MNTKGPTFTFKGDTVRFRKLTAGMTSRFEQAAEGLDGFKSGCTWVEVPTSELSNLVGSFEVIEDDLSEEIGYAVCNAGVGRGGNNLQELAERKARQCINRCFDLANTAWTAAERSQT